MTLADCLARLETLAPPALAESWDNVGLLIGDRAQGVRRVLTCLTLTPDVAREAIDEQVDLIVTHHPVLFRPVQRITSETLEGALLLGLIRNAVAVYSPHTAYDSAPEGINQQLAETLGLTGIEPLRPAAESAEAKTAGGGRCGDFPVPVTLASLAAQAGRVLRARGVQYVGDAERKVSRLAVACGSAAEFLPDAARAGCDALLTGEARFHACLEARELGLALILPGHYATERPAVEALAVRIAAEWPGVQAWASRCETDPLHWRSP